MKAINGAAQSRLRLDTLLELRWCSIALQTIAVLVASVGFNLPFNDRLCLVLIAASAIVNVVLGRARAASYRLYVPGASSVLAFDIALLTTLLFITGGLNNPLAILYAVPVLIAAAALPGAVTFGLALFALVLSCILVFAHRPLPWFGEAPVEFPVLLTTSIWGSLAFTIGICAAFTSRIGAESQKNADALLAVERVLEKEKHLTQLDGLAAAAAHELGTPLATIALVAKELQNEFAEGHVHDDLELLRGQVERCRQILTKLSSLGQNEDDFLDRVSLDHLVHEIACHQSALGRVVEFTKHGDGHEPVILKNAAMLYSLTNLIDNAADFARSRISVRATWSQDQVALEIKDDGPGFPVDLLDKIGEPYLTASRSRTLGRRNQTGGLGIGLFISKTLIERSGARIVFTNAKVPETGAITRVIWPRNVVCPVS